jgi:cysteine desulfurase / selenocysteine lyase
MSVYALGEAQAAARAVVPRIRDRFPGLRRRVHGQPLVYLDSAATAQRPEAVLRAEADVNRHHHAAVHRSLHQLGAEATELYEGARARIARWLGADRAEAVVFTRNATAALNLVARGWEHHLHEGDEILLTEMEHHANLVPWIQLAKRRGLVLRHIPVTAEGTLDLTALPALLSERTRIVSLTHVSNVLGTINPVADIAARAREQGALVVVDAAQSTGHVPWTLDSLGADLVVMSGHKCYGPAGVGVLVGRTSVLERLEPLEGGGDMILEVQLDRATWAEVPQRFEAGSPNTGAAVGLSAALDMLDELGVGWIREHERRLTGDALERLRALDGLRILGPGDPDARGGLVSFVDPEVHPHDMATLLDQRGVAIRAGHHCAQPLHRRLGIGSSTRASFGVYSEPGDVDALIDGVRDARRYFA